MLAKSFANIGFMEPTTRTVRYRVLPGTPAKARRLHRIAGACRYVWNQFIADQEELYAAARLAGASAPDISFFAFGRGFTTPLATSGCASFRTAPFGIR